MKTTTAPPAPTPFQAFPAYRYHQTDETMRPKLVQSQAAADELGADWGERPFGAEAPQPAAVSEDASRSRLSAPLAPAIQKYPAWRYHRLKPAVLVQHPDDEAALGPDWADSPTAFLDDQGRATPLTSAEVQAEQEREAELHTTPAADVVAAVVGMTDPSALRRVASREQNNPSGPRGSVLLAVEERLEACAKAEKAGTRLEGAPPPARPDVRVPAEKPAPLTADEREDQTRARQQQPKGRGPVSLDPPARGKA